MRKIVLLALLTLCVSLSAQTVYYVKLATDDAWSDRENVYTDIQTAINAAASAVSDENIQVWIAKGSYTLTQPLEPKSGVDVIGGFIGDEVDLSERSFAGKGENLTILNGNNSCRVISQNGGLSSPTYWSNLIIENGNSTSIPDGGGATLNSNMTLKGCIFCNNTSEMNGGGAYLYGNACLINCLIEGSKIKKGDITAGGIGIYCKDDSRVINCTVVNNAGSPVYDAYGLGIFAFDNSFIGNTIIWGNDVNYAYSPVGQISLNQQAVATYCAITKGHAGEGNINVSASNTGDYENYTALHFIAPGSDWDLDFESACIDAGNNDLIAGEEFDLNGKKRIIKGIDENEANVDIGAFEFGEDNISIESVETHTAQFYPNPCSGILYSAIESDSAYSIKIISASGITLYEAASVSPSSPIDLSSLPKGTYILRWQTSSDSGSMPLIMK